MRKHFTRLLTTLLALVILLPIVAQAAPTDGWTDEAEQAYQTVTELVVQRVSESKDYLAAATQEENAKAVYALWTSGAAVPSGFYDEYLQALADWLDLAVKRGKTAYIPGAIRTVAAMRLDVTDFAGHDLMDALRKPELVEADEDRLDMLLDLDAAGDAGKTDEFSALREQLLTEALARQQSSGEFRYTSKWPAELKQKGVAAEPDRFDYILLTAKSAQALAPYQSRPEVRAAIEKAVSYLSMQQLDSGGFLRYGEEDVEEDAAVLEMLAALDISPDDGRFVKNGHTVLDGMMDWYQSEGITLDDEIKQGFYADYKSWRYNEYTQLWEGNLIYGVPEQNSLNYKKEIAMRRIYRNTEIYCGLASLLTANNIDQDIASSLTIPTSTGVNVDSIDFKRLLKEQLAASEEHFSSGWYWNEDSTIVSETSISNLSDEILALEKIQGELSSRQKETLQELMGNLTQASSEYLLGRKSATFSPGAVRALQAIGADPGDFNGLDFLTPLINLEGKDHLDYAEGLEDFDSVAESVWRSRGINTDAMINKYATAIIAYQMPNGKFNVNYKDALKSGDAKWIEHICSNEMVAFTAQNVKALGPHQDKEYIAKSVETALEYLSSMQLSDGSFPGMAGQPSGEATYAVLDMMNTLGISLNDERFVKNGNTVADGLRTFYVEGVGFINNPETNISVNSISTDELGLGGGISPLRTVSALTYLQAAENGKFGPDGKGNSVFEIVSAALTETPLGAILLAVIIVALLAFGMVRRYRRIKKEQ